MGLKGWHGYLRNTPTDLKTGKDQSEAFHSTTSYILHISRPDIEFHFVSGSIASDGGRQVRKVQGMSDRLWQVYRPLAFKDAWLVVFYYKVLFK